MPVGTEALSRAYDRGWSDGTMSIGDAWAPDLGPEDSEEEKDEYLEGYKEARRNWAN